MAVTDEAKPRMEDEGEAEPSQRKEKMDVVVVYEGNRAPCSWSRRARDDAEMSGEQGPR
jgi:hypothetical protein